MRLPRIPSPESRPPVDGWIAPPAKNGWHVDAISPEGCRYVHSARRLIAIVTAEVQSDGKPWVHLSLSHRARIPTWGELRVAKDEFLGDVTAYQVLPDSERYVNIHPNVLHLFVCLEGPQLPEFSSLSRNGRWRFL